MDGCNHGFRPPPGGFEPSAAYGRLSRTDQESMTAAPDDLRQVDSLLASINRNLDAMYLKLGKIVVAAETVNEALSELPSPEQLDQLLAVTARRTSVAVDGLEQPPGDRSDSGN